MTVTITLELSPEMEAKLRAGIAHHDAEGIRHLLADALVPTVDILLRQAPDQLSDDEFEALADQLAAELAACMEPDTPALSDAQL